MQILNVYSYVEYDHMQCANVLVFRQNYTCKLTWLKKIENLITLFCIKNSNYVRKDKKDSFITEQLIKKKKLK